MGNCALWCRKRLHDYGVENGGNLIDEGVENGGNLIDDGVENGENLIDDGVENGGNLIDDGLENGRNLLDDGIENGGNLIDVGLENGENLIDDGVETDGNLIDDGVENGENLIDDVVENGGNLIGDGVENGGNLIDDGIENGGNLIDDGVENGGNLIDDGVENGEHLIDDGVENGGNLIDDGFENGNLFNQYWHNFIDNGGADADEVELMLAECEYEEPANFLRLIGNNELQPTINQTVINYQPVIIEHLSSRLVHPCHIVLCRNRPIIHGRMADIYGYSPVRHEFKFCNMVFYVRLWYIWYWNSAVDNSLIIGTAIRISRYRGRIPRWVSRRYPTHPPGLNWVPNEVIGFLYEMSGYPPGPGYPNGVYGYPPGEYGYLLALNGNPPEQFARHTYDDSSSSFRWLHLNNEGQIINNQIRNEDESSDHDDDESGDEDEFIEHAGEFFEHEDELSDDEGYARSPDEFY